jgi:hypothetical protein
MGDDGWVTNPRSRLERRLRYRSAPSSGSSGYVRPISDVSRVLGCPQFVPRTVPRRCCWWSRRPGFGVPGDPDDGGPAGRGRGCARSRRVLLKPGPMPVATRQRRREPARFAGGDRALGGRGRRGLFGAGYLPPPPATWRGHGRRRARRYGGHRPGRCLAVSFPVACARLVNLTHGSSLVSATEDTHGDGYTGLVRVGSAGAAPGA